MMRRVLITGMNSYIGTNVEKWIKSHETNIEVSIVSTRNHAWEQIDFSLFDVVFDVAGIAHVDAKPKMEPLYREINTKLTLEIAKKAKEAGVRQFIFMSSQIVYHESNSLKADIIDLKTKPNPNTFYGDSKLQAENGLRLMENDSFKVAIIRTPMVYGPNCKGNFLRLAKLATVTPVFPAFHNKRSMIYIDNLSEFVLQVIKHKSNGVLFPQNAELADTVEIVKAFAKKYNHKIHIWRWLNIFVYLLSPFIKSINKMFADLYYIPEMSSYEFDYQLVDMKSSFSKIDIGNVSLTKMN